MVVDLSYAKNMKPPEDDVSVMGLAVSGWSVGWAIASNEQPKKVGFVLIPDRSEGVLLHNSRRAVMLFKHLAQVLGTEGVKLIVQEFDPHPHGPNWNVPPLLAMAMGVGYTEVKEYLEVLGVDESTVTSWATVAMGKAPESPLITTAIGVSVVASHLVKVQRQTLPDIEERLKI